MASSVYKDVARATFFAFKDAANSSPISATDFTPPGEALPLSCSANNTPEAAVRVRKWKTSEVVMGSSLGG